LGFGVWGAGLSARSDGKSPSPKSWAPNLNSKPSISGKKAQQIQ
jgi:hypothetical protein